MRFIEGVLEQEILKLQQEVKENSTDGTTLEDYIIEWANAEDADITEDGDIYIYDSYNPNGGHWLNDDEKRDFLSWFYSL